jgi:hypothetical protein
VKLTFRIPQKDDFDAFFDNCFPPDAEPALRRAVQHEWRVFINNPTTVGMIVEDLNRAQEYRIVGMAQTVFVTDEFVTYLRSGVPPYANMHASRALPSGAWPLLTPCQVRDANSTGGLNALITRWGWADRRLDAEEQLQVRNYINEVYPFFYRGYRYRELLMDATGEWSYQGLLNAGFRLRNDYAGFSDGSSAPSSQNHPYLVGVTREEALAGEGSFVSRIFAYTPPRFHFKPWQQEMLQHVMLDQPDAEVAAICGITLDGMKRRWIAIYDRVGQVDPNLLPEGQNGLRGPEKRERLLGYLRYHLEELRPACDPSVRS